MRASQLLFSCVVALAVLTGCASAPSRPPGTTIDVQDLQQWRARGRIGVSSAEGGGSGSFEWAQRDDVADVRIRGPIGIGSVRLMIKGSGPTSELELQTGDGVTLAADAAWAELEARLGASLPASQFRYWLLGRAAPGPHQWSGAGEEGTAILEQQGWRIDYQRYSNESGAKLPTRLRAMNGDTQVRVVIDGWQLDR